MINARNTPFAVFDEPEAGIDLWSFGSLITVFERMYEKNKGSILIITHQERILDIADTVIVLSEGRVTAMGSKEEILPDLFGTQRPCRVIVGGEG